jgi:hypothetical protein
MTALLLVLPTSWITEASAEGMYRLNVLPGRYRLCAWSERSQPVTVEVSAEEAAIRVPEIALDESTFVEIPHKNKYGQNYSASAYEAQKR